MPRVLPMLLLLVAATTACRDDPPAGASTEPRATDSATDRATDAAGDAEAGGPEGPGEPDRSSQPHQPPVIEVDEPDTDARAGASLALSHPAAFDLVGTPPGVTLVWADDAAVHAARLSPDGDERRRTVVAEVRGVAELAAAATADRLGAIWIDGDSRLGTANGSVSALTFDPPRPLGATERTRAAGRGRLAAAVTATGRLLALARTGDEPCQRYDEPSCANFAILDLIDARARRRPGLEVPHPCAHPVAGFAVADAHWHYAVCHHDGPTPTTILFTAQQTPSYAQTNELLSGCRPRGLTRHDDDLWLTGVCGGVQRTVHVRELHVTPGAWSPGTEIGCAEDRLVVGSGPDRVELDEHTVGLGALLPESLAPDGTRAVWTGRSLVLARPDGDRLSIERHQCQSGTLRRTP